MIIMANTSSHNYAVIKDQLKIEINKIQIIAPLKRSTNLLNSLCEMMAIEKQKYMCSDVARSRNK